jgi:hypothetical protein
MTSVLAGERHVLEGVEVSFILMGMRPRTMLLSITALLSCSGPDPILSLGEVLGFAPGATADASVEDVEIRGFLGFADAGLVEAGEMDAADVDANDAEPE